MWHNICFWYFEWSNLTDCKICKILEGYSTLRILGGILLLIWTYYLFLLKHLLIIIAGTFESRKEGRSKEEKGVMTSEKWIGRSEESMKIV